MALGIQNVDWSFCIPDSYGRRKIGVESHGRVLGLKCWMESKAWLYRGWRARLQCGPAARAVAEYAANWIASSDK